MNERIQEFAEQIKKLAEQAYEYAAVDGVVNSSGDEFDIFKEKLAELILKEVMQVLLSNGHVDAFDFLNEHFGVK